MSPGVTALQRIIANRNVKQKTVASESGISESKLSLILSEKAAPNLKEAIALQKWGGIDPALWTTPKSGEVDAKGAA